MPSNRTSGAAAKGQTSPVAAPVSRPTFDFAGRKVFLVGFTQTREEAPYDDPEAVIVGCNNVYKFVPRVDILFDLHDRQTIAEDPEHEQWLREGHAPVVMWRHDPEFPSSVAYPLDEVRAEFGDYWTNSISLMTAWALLYNPSFLGIVGVDMAQGTEYAAQRPSCEWMIGHAEARLGRNNVYIPKTSDLLKTAGVYGLADNGPFVAKLNARKVELAARKQQLEQQHAQLSAQADEIEKGIYQLLGALEDVNYITGVWLMPEGTRNGADPLADAN